MKRTEEQLTEAQLEERYQFIENRIKNMFWTVSGDYSLDIHADVRLFARSKYAAFYEAVKQGAFAQYFDKERLSVYLLKKVYLGADEAALTELGQLCVDAAVYPKLKNMRRGTEELRQKAFSDLLDEYLREMVDKSANQMHRGGKRQVSRKSQFERVRIYLMVKFLEGEPDVDPGKIREYRRCFDAEIRDIMCCSIAEEVAVLEQAETTDEIIEIIEGVYNRYCDPDFEKEHGDLQRVRNVSMTEIGRWAWQDCMSDEEMEEIIQNYLSKMGRRITGLGINRKAGKKYGLSAEERAKREKPEFNEEAAARVKEYVALNYGKSYLSELEQEQINRKLCRGIHQGCILHYTNGILHDPVLKNNQYRFSQFGFEKNRMYYYNNHWIIKRNIAELADTLSKALTMRKQEEINRSVTGQLVPARLWKVGRTSDKNLFDRKTHPENSDFVVDILLDASGSQAKRQPQVAAQGYIISEALSAVGIPHRVQAYSTFWNHSIIQRFRDYDDKKEMNERIFEFRALANNRDGLAIKAAAESLNARPEEQKIMIILSDGRPNDIGMSRPGIANLQNYTGETAARDTAMEVRRARNAEFSVFGIFIGAEEDLPTEKRIFGKDFAYIRNISNFSRMVGSYLKEQFEATDCR